jgi:hypothetical protein
MGSVFCFGRRESGSQSVVGCGAPETKMPRKKERTEKNRKEQKERKKE